MVAWWWTERRDRGAGCLPVTLYSQGGVGNAVFSGRGRKRCICGGVGNAVFSGRGRKRCICGGVGNAVFVEG